MNKLLVLIFTFSILSINLMAQIDLKGQVLFNNEPVISATVFLNNTTIGNTTDQNGFFTLNIKEGAFELIISYLGYKTIKYDSNTSTDNSALKFSLEEQEFAFSEVVVSAKRNDDDWKYHLSVFEREFIGITEFSQQCKILNPKVLFFDFNIEENTVTAYSREPIHIRNEALGYDVFFTLENFVTGNNKTFFLGYTQFKNLKGRKRKQRKWTKNRLIAYNGSSVHFFKSVLNNTAKEEGYIIHQFLRKENEDRPSEEEIVKARSLISLYNQSIDFTKNIDQPKTALDSAKIVMSKVHLPKFADYLYKSDLPASDLISIKSDQTYLDFKDNLIIVYTKEKEELGYIIRDVFSKRRKALAQTSSIIPIIRPSIIDQTGVLLNPLNIFYEGYWSYEKFAHSLPLDYEPTEEE